MKRPVTISCPGRAESVLAIPWQKRAAQGQPVCSAHRLRIGNCLPVLALAAGLLLSCGKEETGGVTSLPQGIYPLQLTAEVAQPQTRAGGKDSWAGGEEIGVMLQGMTEAKKYIIEDASGKANPAAGNVVYWQSRADTQVSAWYPYTDGSPVNISDQSSGYAAFDLLYASTLGHYGLPVNLTFNHLLTKIEIKLTAGSGITAEHINGATVTLFGENTVSFNKGTVGAAVSHNGEIKPYHNTTEGRFEAVVVPQNMTGKPLVRIGIGGKDFLYTPATEASGNLETNKRYSYLITVKANGIEVKEVTGGSWSAGGEEDVTVIVVTNYTADEVKAGDYIYTDGSISDGGLRKRYSNGTAPVIENPKPLPEPGKTVAGIVFWVPKDTESGGGGRITPASLTDDKIMATDYPACTRGLAVAVKNVSTDIKWQKTPRLVDAFRKGANFDPINKDDYVSVVTGTNATDAVNYILGYQNTAVIKAFNSWCKSTSGTANNVVLPVDALESFTTTNPAPAGSTGWFIPSPKELHILCYKDVDNIATQYGNGKTETMKIVNASITEASGDVLGSVRYWSSSEAKSDYTLCFSVDFKTAVLFKDFKDSGTPGVRAVCAF